MIRINLAGEWGAGRSEPPGRMGRAVRGRAFQRLLSLGMMLGAASVVLSWRMEQAARGQRLEAQIQQVRGQRQRQLDLSREIRQLEQQGLWMEGRIRAIERLRARQARPARVLDLLGDCVQAVPGLRLQEVSRKDGAFSLRGLVSAQSERVSEFVARLQRTGEFHRVELVHFQEQDGQYAFALSLEEAAPEESGNLPQESPGGAGDRK